MIIKFARIWILKNKLINFIQNMEISFFREFFVELLTLQNKKIYCIFSEDLKGVFAKSESGYGLNAIKKRFWVQTIVIDYFFNNFRWRLIFEHSWKIWKCRLHYQKSWKGINVFKSNSQIMKNTKYYEISTIYECVSKIIDDYCL